MAKIYGITWIDLILSGQNMLIWSMILACSVTPKISDTDDVVNIVYDQDGDGYNADEDCDDGNPLIFPGTVEQCNGVDDNCDGQVDEGVLNTFYLDADIDGFGAPGEETEACEVPEGYAAVGSDCDDLDSEVYPGAVEICDEKDNNCDEEIDNGVGEIMYPDIDSDGYGDSEGMLTLCEIEEGFVSQAGDCDDSNATVYIGADELCDDLDNDCDDEVDEGVGFMLYVDADSDGFGSSTEEPVLSCVEIEGYLTTNSDCNDADTEIYPGANEVCDYIDNDCNGSVDDNALDAVTWYEDVDSDGYGGTSTIMSCASPAGYVVESDDCDDFNNTIHPGAPEECDGIDNDCSGVIDDNPIDGVLWYADLDEDGFGDPDDTLNACTDTMPVGYILEALDCDDSLASVYPDADELCNSIDDDCNGTIDDEPIDGSVYYQDADGDGYGNPLISELYCTPVTGFEVNADDCNDDRADLFPESGFCPSGNDCLDILDSGLSVGDGTYDIDIDGSGVGSSAFSVDCDMTSDGGGWTGITFGDSYNYLSGSLISQGTNVNTSIDQTTGPRTRDSGNQSHYYFYEFDYPSGYTEFYLNNWSVRAYASSGSTSEVCGSIVNWSAGLVSHGDVALGSPDDTGPVASMYPSTASGCFFSCRDCTVAWPQGQQVYETDMAADQMRIAWGEYGSQSEGWYPWYGGTVYLR